MADISTKLGKMIGVGTGPGDPELLTLKAHNAITNAKVIAYFCKRNSKGQGYKIVEQFIPKDIIELPLAYPVTVEISKYSDEYKNQIDNFFNESAERIKEYLLQGIDVIVLSEGDPLFYGSYMHVHERLCKDFPTEIIAGISAMSGSWSQASKPLVQGDDILNIIPGSLSEDTIAKRLDNTEGAVIMKIGRNLGKVKRALARINRLSDATYVERATMQESRHMPLNDYMLEEAPYFSIVLVEGWKHKNA